MADKKAPEAGPIGHPSSGKSASALSSGTLRFSETLDFGKYGKILTDPDTGDVAVILSNGKTVILKERETWTSAPPYGSIPTAENEAIRMGADGSPFFPRFESRKMETEELIQAAEEKTRSKRDEFRANVPELLSNQGIAIEHSNGEFVLVSSYSKKSVTLPMSGKNEYEKERKVVTLFLMLQRALETMSTCRTKDKLVADCQAYSDSATFELKIDDANWYGDTTVASDEEIASLTQEERQDFARVLAPFLNEAFEARRTALPYAKH